MRNTVTLRPKFSLFPKRGDEAVTFAPDAPQTVSGPPGELPQIAGTQVGQFALLPIGPEVFDRIEFGSIGREAFDPEFAAQFGNVLAHDLGAVDGGPVPDDEQAAGHMALEVVEELNDLRALDTALKKPEVAVPKRDAGDRREIVPAEWVEKQRRLALGRPSPHAVRLLGQPALVDEDNGAPFGLGFLFSASHVLRFQRAMACSSRSMARPTGFWQLQPKRWERMRMAVVGWQVTPNSRRMTLATRGSVQSGVGKPDCCGPAVRISASRASCSGVSRGLRPARPAAFNASIPPSSRARFQRRTDWRLAPTRRATSACDMPFSKSRLARIRRFSMPAKSRFFAMTRSVADLQMPVTIICSPQ